MTVLKWFRLTFILVAMTWALSQLTISCTGDDDDDTAEPTPTVTATPPVGNQVGNTALDFTLNDMNETAISLSQFKGQVILLDLSTMWCPSCKTEASRAEALYQEFQARGFTIINVLFQDNGGAAADAADCATWVNKYGLTFPVLYDIGNQIWNMYDELGYIPLNLVIDKNFVIVYKDIGYNENAIRSAIEASL